MLLCLPTDWTPLVVVNRETGITEMTFSRISVSAVEREAEMGHAEIRHTDGGSLRLVEARRVGRE